jgi:outer membrane protein OmpA-like peptidoglycan-associated protein
LSDARAQTSAAASDDASVINEKIDAGLRAAAAANADNSRHIVALGQRLDEATNGATTLAEKLGRDERGVAASNDAIRADLTALKSTSGSALQAIVDRAAAIETNLASEAQRDDATTDALQQAVAADSKRIDGLVARLDTPHERLVEAARGLILFATAQDAMRNPDAAHAVLDTLAAALIASGENIRVVGYSDLRGEAKFNLDLSRRRAEKVAKLLVERGVPTTALTVAARGAQKLTDSGGGVAGPDIDRRVAFELTARTEPKP